MDRYQRQIILPGMGIEGQTKLAQTRVLVIGAGGLGCPVLLQCALMGIGTIGIVDSDKVALHNLHRQSLYDENSVGCYKVEVAQKVLNAKNTSCKIETFPFRIDVTNIFQVIEGYDIVVDATDNFLSRYIINDACVASDKILIHGSIFQYEGQVAVFNYPTPNGRSAHYRDIYEHPPQTQGISCAETGVIGALTHIIGDFMAAEIFKILVGTGTILYNKILHYQLLSHQVDIYNIHPAYGADKPLINRLFVETYPYRQYCGIEQVLDAIQIKEMILENTALLVDVRSTSEMPKLLFPHVQKELVHLWDDIDWLQQTKNIIFVCQSGSRSKQALQQGIARFPDLKWYVYDKDVTTLNAYYE